MREVLDLEQPVEPLPRKISCTAFCRSRAVRFGKSTVSTSWLKQEKQFSELAKLYRHRLRAYVFLERRFDIINDGVIPRGG